MIRYVQKGRFPLEDNRPGECQLCGTRWGVSHPKNVCDATICLNCGTRQCMVNGLGKGQCSICLVGFLLGWSGDNKMCGYASCSARAVAVASRVGRACRQHFRDADGHVWRDRRAKVFVPVDDAGYMFSERYETVGFDWDSVQLIR